MEALQLLSRSEIRKIKGGAPGHQTECPEDFSACSCTGPNDEHLGGVCCSEGIGVVQCCQAQYPTTARGFCLN